MKIRGREKEAGCVDTVGQIWEAWTTEGPELWLNLSYSTGALVLELPPSHQSPL